MLKEGQGGRHMANTWQANRHMADTWLANRHVADTWQTHGRQTGQTTVSAQNYACRYAH